MANLVGKLILDRYQIEEVIGNGGFGIVYLAYDQRRKRKVALKQNPVMDSLHQSMLEKEANVLATLNHPSLPRIYDFWENGPGGINCIVIDFIEGMNLGQAVFEKGHRYPEKQIITWISQISDAVSYMHNHKPSLLHLDIKPENIMVQENRAM